MQMSGQGPYYGQAAWFQLYHAEVLPSAQQRYIKEMSRVQSVLDTALQGQQGLVGDKVTYVDLAFIPWHSYIPRVMKGEKLETEGQFPNYDRWMNALLSRPAVKKVMAERKAIAGV